MPKSNNSGISGLGVLKSALESAGLWSFSADRTRMTVSKRAEDGKGEQTASEGLFQRSSSAVNIAPVATGELQGNQFCPLEEDQEQSQREDDEAREVAARKEQLREKVGILSPVTTQPQFKEPKVMEPTYHYDHSSEVPNDIKKYWMQRYSIFSKYDDGIKLTDDAWFEVTPEPVAIKIAEHISKAAPAHKKVLIDAFGGCGGNVIQFALSGRWDRIFAVENDSEKVRCARHNSEIYGVGKKVFWITGDVFEALRKRLKSLGKEAVIFASPPWGGPGYRDAEVFDLETMTPYWLEQMYSSFAKVTKDIVLYLPRTSDLNQIAKYVPDGEKIQVTHYCMNGASKALCVYYGDFQKIEMRA